MLCVCLCVYFIGSIYVHSSNWLESIYWWPSDKLIVKFKHHFSIGYVFSDKNSIGHCIKPSFLYDWLWPYLDTREDDKLHFEKVGGKK